MLRGATRSSMRALPVTGGLLALLTVGGCQPVDSGVLPDGGDGGQAAPAGEASEQADALVADLPGLLAGFEETAQEWQAEPVLAEIYVGLDGDAWREATAIFLAPDADRMIVFQVDGDGTRQQRPTLETLDLEPVPAAGLAEVPPLPGGTLPPAELVAAAAGPLESCEVGEVDSVLYSTGAPAAWDGTTWTEAPAWTATLGGDRGSLMVDPVTGEAHPDGCLAAE